MAVIWHQQAARHNRIDEVVGSKFQISCISSAWRTSSASTTIYSVFLVYLGAKRLHSQLSSSKWLWYGKKWSTSQPNCEFRQELFSTFAEQQQGNKFSNYNHLMEETLENQFVKFSKWEVDGENREQFIKQHHQISSTEMGFSIYSWSLDSFYLYFLEWAHKNFQHLCMYIKSIIFNESLPNITCTLLPPSPKLELLNQLLSFGKMVCSSKLAVIGALLNYNNQFWCQTTFPSSTMPRFDPWHKSYCWTVSQTIFQLFKNLHLMAWNTR